MMFLFYDSFECKFMFTRNVLHIRKIYEFQLRYYLIPKNGEYIFCHLRPPRPTFPYNRCASRKITDKRRRKNIVNILFCHFLSHEFYVRLEWKRVPSLHLKALRLKVYYFCHLRFYYQFFTFICTDVKF